jgi:hypothetical protein
MKQKAMKTILFKLLFIGICLIGFAGISKGQPENTPVCISLYITDNCSGQWNGYYFATVTVYHGGEFYCRHTFYNLDDGYEYEELSYDCTDAPIEYYTRSYTIYVRVCRQEENPSCCDEGSKGPMFWNDLDDCVNNHFDMTLTN